MMSLESSTSMQEFRKLLREYSQYSVNVKNWLYEDLTSIMGQSPPGRFFESVYRDAHLSPAEWMKEMPGISREDDSATGENET
ncbi:MAG: hypothetical protein M1129_03245 [Candidatus Thermoplasmatota archaeon]|nr:hypothetical protein [Candidatus Thermoplasmatota archaeon]MCL5954843.1 hypothetical protein [Candidatus Thermoplasmatota archaeon]